ncbi:DNA cytosine methyltransferase [Microbacterium sp. p3-SID131]|uniref:DNA cytosine methyltransferase n=1 Tax=Microbacterium sp. p3-SID131 TaxID=2916215 RepID=UPI0021A279CA|nr:DNA cytosine methyltransferase [Microbacterium sp. p3-SID131]MCT1363943.1 DNA cytosine methyltransferase [Microbacterium sp. p3-SID131]
MTALKSGELFAGVGGLGMAVDEVFGSEPAWFAEFDVAPSKVLAHHYPDVPNYGDVRAVDFRTVPHTQIRAGGFPCQDVSLAGRRRGMSNGTRSGLWSEFARSIEEDRPDWVVIENVRGLLSADASGGNLEPCPWCVGDEPSEHALRALGAVLGDLADLGFDAEWVGLRASDVGAPHGRFRIFILAWPRERTTPDAGRRRSSGRASGSEQAGRDDATVGSDPRGDGGRAHHGLNLLPTPVAQPSGNSPEDHLRKKPGRETVTDLAIIAENGLIGSGGRLLPTPGAYDGERGGSQHPDKRRAGNHSVTIQDVAEHLTLMPTPRASRGGSATETMYALGAERVDDERPQGQVVADVTDWGPYAAAIARWATTTGRAAPVPVRYDGKGGKARLNPELTEWMMGWPAGWVTASVIGLTRAEQLKACGNGVVPQQAALALRILLARPGVPSIREAVAA